MYYFVQQIRERFSLLFVFLELITACLWLQQRGCERSAQPVLMNLSSSLICFDDYDLLPSMGCTINMLRWNGLDRVREATHQVTTPVWSESVDSQVYMKESGNGSRVYKHIDVSAILWQIGLYWWDPRVERPVRLVPSPIDSWILLCCLSPCRWSGWCRVRVAWRLQKSDCNALLLICFGLESTSFSYTYERPEKASYFSFRQGHLHWSDADVSLSLSLLVGSILVLPPVFLILRRVATESSWY